MEEEVEHQRKRPSLSLKGRFKKTSDKQLKEMKVPHIPKNTSASTRWAFKNLGDWFVAHNSEATSNDDRCPDDVLSPSCSPEVLNRWLCVFVSETRGHNGEPYPSRTLYAILTGIIRYMRSNNPNYPNFLEKKSPAFVEFMSTLDNLFKKLRSEGVGSSSAHTEGISREEDELWSSGVLNINTPLGLLRAVFYYNGKCLCLRGGQEHRCLKLSQLKWMKSPDRYEYVENSSKNRKGGISELRLEHKNVSSFADTEAGVRCHVFILDLYIQKLPQEAHDKDLFYCRPLPNKPADEEKPWYSAVPIGISYRKWLAACVRRHTWKAKKATILLRLVGPVLFSMQEYLRR